MGCRAQPSRSRAPWTRSWAWLDIAACTWPCAGRPPSARSPTPIGTWTPWSRPSVAPTPRTGCCGAAMRPGCSRSPATSDPSSSSTASSPGSRPRSARRSWGGTPNGSSASEARRRPAPACSGGIPSGAGSAPPTLPSIPVAPGPWPAPGRAAVGSAVARIVPGPVPLDQVGRRGRAPGAGAVGQGRRMVAEHPVDHLPGGLDRVLAREQRRVALERIGEQPLVVELLLGPLLAQEQLPLLAHELLAGPLDAGRERDRGARSDLEAQIVAAPGRLPGIGEDLGRRSLELDQDLGGGDRQPLPRPQVEGHAMPAPAVQVEA